MGSVSSVVGGGGIFLIPNSKSITGLAVTNMQKCVFKCCDISSSLNDTSVRMVKTSCVSVDSMEALCLSECCFVPVYL